MHRRYALLLVCAFAVAARAQSVHVQRKADLYQPAAYEHAKRDYSLTGASLSETAVKPFLIAYWIFIADADGDLCPFEPSCSAFFLQGLKKTNLAEATLLFADRFTRDANIYNRFERYRFDYRAVKFLDPVERYLKRTAEGVGQY